MKQPWQKILAQTGFKVYRKIHRKVESIFKEFHFANGDRKGL